MLVAEDERRRSRVARIRSADDDVVHPPAERDLAAQSAELADDATDDGRLDAGGADR